MFPWASGGNLGDYWQNFEMKTLDIGSLQWIIDQFVGISSGLEELHNENCRHGDLKPENILWFKDSNDMGTFQIADLGLAAFHEKEANTNIRQKKDINTLTPSGTSRYEPPEMDRDRASQAARSRQYDIWSMGCILLELLIWLSYGYPAVKTFRENTKYFWQLQPRNRYIVHPYVVACMDIMNTQLQGDTAYKELLHLVRTKLLIVKFSETYESKPEHREIAKALRERMEDIQQKYLNTPAYLRPVQLEYPSDQIINHAPQPGAVYENEAGLATPPRPDTPRNIRPLPPTRVTNEEQEDEEQEDGFRLLVDAPPGDGSDSISKEVSRSSEHQEVGEPKHLRNMNL